MYSSYAQLAQGAIMPSWRFGLFLLISLELASAQFCPSNSVLTQAGVSCQYDQTCLGYDRNSFCYRGYCCSRAGFGSGLCGLGQINVNGFCYSLAGYLQRCDTGEQCSFPGGICITNVCRCTPGFVFSNNECQVDSNVIPPLIKACNANQVFINQQCLSIAGVNGPCFYDLQCQEPGNSLLFCSNGFCQYRSGGNGLPVCQAPGMQPEIVNGVAKNCLQQYCSAGYQCEYNRNYRGGQYICCGSSNSGFYGAIKMYPGMNKPLQCFAINSCTFVDYPHCVFSQRYGHNVCCSKKNCY